MRINKVLIAVDFSPPSTLAVNYGIAFARQFRARLSLLHVVESRSGLLHPFPAEAAKFETQRQKQAVKMLAALLTPEDEEDLDAHLVVRAGEIEDIIGSVVEEEQADVIVMGLHGRGLFGRMILGSVTETLLRKLPVPVLTVCHVSRPLEFRRILLANDFGFDSYKGFGFALDLAETAHCSLLVAHTIDAGPVSEERKQVVKYVHERFADFEAEGAKRKVSVECVLAEGGATESLLRIADEREADFIILGLRKKRLIERALMGSTAEALIRAARVPVLSVPIDTKVTVVEDEPTTDAG